MPDDNERARRPPQELRRLAPFSLRSEDVEGPDDGLTLDGYAAVFKRRTTIDSWEGRFREEIAPGSMKKSFRENPPLIQFDHGHHPLIGSIPIAAPSPGFPREEVDPALAPDGGAHIVGRLHDNWLVQPVRDAMASQAISGMSFRFSVVAEMWHDADGKQIRDEATLLRLLEESWREDVPEDQLLVRTLKELKVPELGPVVWPAYAETSVGVRSLTIDLGNLSDPETRNTLARAVFLADVAKSDEDAPSSTGMAAAHASKSTDTPQATPSGAGEHGSTAETLRRRNRLRNAARAHQGYMLTIQEEN